jgi:hypothetical protein
MGDLDLILARLERLEAENVALREQLAGQREVAAPAGPVSSKDRVSRRGLLRQAGAGAAAVGIGVIGASMASLAGPGPVRANGEPVTVGGSFVDAITTTTIRNHTNDNDVLFASSSGQGTGVHGYSGTGAGIYGETTSGYGVHGESLSDSVGAGVYGRSTANIGVVGSTDSGIGVQGQSTSGDAVAGGSTSGMGVRGFSTSGNGVHGYSQSSAGVMGLSPRGNAVLGRTEGPVGVGVRGYAGDDVPPGGTFGTGVLGSSGLHTYPAGRANTGVMGIGAKGRGGVFIGDRAQVQLVASGATSHPASGARGDLFVDKSGRLWFCKGGTTWRQLA